MISFISKSDQVDYGVCKHNLAGSEVGQSLEVVLCVRFDTDREKTRPQSILAVV